MVFFVFLPKILFCKIIHIMLNSKYWNTTPSIKTVLFMYPSRVSCLIVSRPTGKLNLLIYLQLKYIHRNHRASLGIGQSIVMVLFDVVAEMHSDGLQFVVLQIWHQLL